MVLCNFLKVYKKKDFLSISMLGSVTDMSYLVLSSEDSL